MRSLRWQTCALDRPIPDSIVAHNPARASSIVAAPLASVTENRRRSEISNAVGKIQSAGDVRQMPARTASREKPLLVSLLLRSRPQLRLRPQSRDTRRLRSLYPLRPQEVRCKSDGGFARKGRCGRVRVLCGWLPGRSSFFQCAVAPRLQKPHLRPPELLPALRSIPAREENGDSECRNADLPNRAEQTRRPCTRHEAVARAAVPAFGRASDCAQPRSSKRKTRSKPLE